MAKFDWNTLLGGEAVSKLDTNAQNGKTTVMIPLQNITASEGNFYGMRQIEEMADSILNAGQIEPAVVEPFEDGYKLISGERRFRALELLTERGTEGFDQLWCVIEQRDLSAPMRKIVLIEANRQREKTAYEKTQEVEQLTEAFIALRESGVELKGKIRDMVAEQLKISASSVQRLQSINNNLSIPGYIRDFETDALPESVAYEISRLSHEEQYRFLDYQIDQHKAPSLPLIQKFRKLQMFDRDCKHGGRCKHVEVIVSHFVKKGSLDGCAGCCAACVSRNTCEFCCEFEKPQAPEPAKTYPTPTKKNDGWSPVDMNHLPKINVPVLLAYSSGLGCISYVVGSLTWVPDEYEESIVFENSESGCDIDYAEFWSYFTLKEVD